MISLKQLQYALAVEKSLHFKKAAEVCNVSPSALSTALHELESQLNLKIFERDTKRVLVTPAGKSILKRARKIMLEIEDLQADAALNADPLTAPMDIGVIPTIAPFLLPNFLNNLNEHYPDMTLHVSEDRSHALVEKVRNGELDAAILALPYPCEGLLKFEFWQEDFYWVARKDNKLAQLEQIQSEELEESDLLLLKEGHCLKDHILDACHFNKKSAVHGFTATSLNTLVQMVAGGLGTTLVPEMSLHQLMVQNPNLASVHLNEPGPHRTIAFIMRPGYPRVSSIESLRDIAKKSLDTLRVSI